jgi:hypothetical protein
MLALLASEGCTTVKDQPAEYGESASRFGRLDHAYDRTQWRWHRNADGRALLAHNAVSKCYVDAQPSEDFVQPGFSVKRETKTIGGTPYDVLHVFEKRQFSEAIYVRSGATTPTLGVYSAGKCQEEAERILEAYEKSAGR